ncbi:MAG: Spy/CpxP family protein refolding chaperone [Pseudomonadota bacterium]|nr:Spy/CpxP family protein refolding chaperone [Pseudomonadota bacterium]
MKKLMIALSIGTLTMSGISTASYASDHKKMAKPSAEFFQQLDHASFMPNLMKYIKQNKAELKVTKEQMKALKAYHKENSPIVHKMVKQLTKAEAKAKTMALENFPPEAVAKVGRQSLDIRHDLMMAKLKCRSFVKSVLNPKQYKKALTSYK